MNKKIIILIFISTLLTITNIILSAADYSQNTKKEEKIINQHHTIIKKIGLLPPQLSFYPSVYNLGDVKEGFCDKTSFEIWNSGCCGKGNLSYSLYVPCNWVDINPNSGYSYGERDKIKIYINTTGLSLGNQVCMIYINSNRGSGYFNIIANITEQLNDPPNRPIIHGPEKGKVKKEYEFILSATDPQEDDITLFIDWGDTTDDQTEYISSGEKITIMHSWQTEGAYDIKAKSIDQYDAESNWTYHDVTMPKSKTIQKPVYRFIENHPFLFPLLWKLLK